MTQRILIMAGGTGGHVFPALAVAQQFRQMNIDVDWMGTSRGIEARLVPAAGYPLHEISVRGLRGNGVLGWLLAPWRVIKAVLEARAVLRKISPDAVIGLGGFASGPGGLAAKLSGIPLLIHEQNAIPGLTNRLLARLANIVMEGFPNSFSAKVRAEWVGNPVRAEIEQIAAPEQRFANRDGAMRLLILGGSLGARSLNTVLPEALSKLDANTHVEVRHQCGEKHLEDCQQAYTQAGVSARVSAFIDDMAEAYAWADLVICRSGALTVAEVAAAGLGAILVPYPYAVDDHQTHNAAMLVEAGAARLIADNQLDADKVAGLLKHFAENRQSLIEMANAARTVAKTGSAQLIANRCLEVANG